MLGSVYSALLLSLACLAAASEEISATYLKADNFWNEVDGSKTWVVAFVAPWCGHCKSLKPEFGTADKALKGDADNFQLALFDADAERDFAGAFEVSGYPTIKVFKKGHAAKDPKAAEAYDGPRDAEGIVEWAKTKFGTTGHIVKPPTAWKELDPANFDDVVMNEEKGVLVAFTAPWCGHCKNMKNAYSAVAAAFKNEKNCVVAHVNADQHRSIGQRFDVSGFPTIKFFPKGSDKTPVVFDGARDEPALIAFLNEKCGTHRSVGGGLAEQAGRVEELDAIVNEYVEGASAADVLKKLEVVVKESAESTATWYLKTMKKVAEKGDKFVATELKRLQTMVAGGKVKADKVDEFYYRINILKAFSGKKADSKDEL